MASPSSSDEKTATERYNANIGSASSSRVEHRSVSINYRYETPDNSSFLYDTQTECVMNSIEGEVNLEEYNFAYNCSHNNYLRCYILDKKSGNIFYEVYDLTLEEKINCLQSNGIYPLRKYRFANRTGRIVTSTYVDEEYRKLIKSMVTFLCEIHKAGYATTGFGMSNIVMKDEVYKFWKIKFVQASKNSINKDFSCLGSMVQYLFSIQVHPLRAPVDMQHLLDTLGSSSAWRKNELINNHIAVMSHEKKVFFFTACWEKQNSLNPFNALEYEQAISNLGNNKGWTAKLRNPDLGPLNDCYLHHITLTNGRGYDDQNSSSNVCNTELVKCWRNLGIHVKDKGKQYGTSFTEMDADVMVMHAFGQEITKFYTWLCNGNVIRSFISS